MSKIGNNPILQKVSGKLGNTIVFRQGPTGPIMANVPKKATSVHEKQIVVRERFLDAVQYANRQMLKDDVKAMYATGISKKKPSAYQVAVSDYLGAPKIKQIEADAYRGDPGKTIYVYASDDFRVASVAVVITSAAGEEIERGEAVLSTDLRDVWIYTTTASVSAFAGTVVSATAKDIPGNATLRTLTF
ncbi:hypothetical protein WBG78_07315 [Chryseolinea sp. T2]|uniref:hypothetical protein n=1 Tax=Chryseolinea sp. T2 TaxID=3129255 RepID=UPI0030785C19